jgi:hypothetical protein
VHAAAHRGFASIVQVLADAWANLTLRNRNGQTPLGYGLSEPLQTTFRGGPIDRTPALDLLRKLRVSE